jgi:hypothetical protein
MFIGMVGGEADPIHWPDVEQLPEDENEPVSDAEVVSELELQMGEGFVALKATTGKLFAMTYGLNYTIAIAVVLVVPALVAGLVFVARGSGCRRCRSCRHRDCLLHLASRWAVAASWTLCPGCPAQNCVGVRQLCLAEKSGPTSILNRPA